jgi:hypothetical protein
MTNASGLLDRHPEHRTTNLDQLILHQLESCPYGLTALQLVEGTGASMRYVEHRITVLNRVGLLQRTYRADAAGRKTTTYVLPDITASASPRDDSGEKE